MIKNNIKITSIIASIITVSSIIPVHAAEYSNLDTKEGTIYSATAKGKGIFIDGEINGEDEAVYWLSEDGKYNKLEDIDTGATLKDLLSGKYLEIDDGSSSYSYIDISNNYKLLDYDVREELENNAARTIKNKIKKDNDGRFNEDFYKNSTKISATKEGKNGFLNSSTGLAIYKYKLEASKPSSNDFSTIYGDSKGNYVDADYNLGKIKVRTSTTGSAVTIKNTEDTYEVKENNKTYLLKAEINQNKYITVSSDTAYRYADLTIYKKEKNAEDSEYIPVTDELLFGDSGNKVTNTSSVTVLQKFSLTPNSDTIDGIKYSKDSTIYFITDEDGNNEYLLGKSPQDAANKVNAALGGKGKLVATAQGFNSMYLDSKNEKLFVETIKLKTKKSFNYLDVSDPVNTKVDSTNALNTPGGLPWFIKDRYVMAWDGNKAFNKIYSLDNSIDNISLTTKDNLIAWNNDKEIYTLVHTIPNTTSAETNVSATSNENNNIAAPNNAGWVLNSDNLWNYILDDSSKKTGWLNTNNAWYYLKADGVMATGWINDNGTWYYLDPNGSMKTGWLNDNGNWYYLNQNGAMLYNTTIDGYNLGGNGSLI